MCRCSLARGIPAAGDARGQDPPGVAELSAMCANAQRVARVCRGLGITAEEHHLLAPLARAAGHEWYPPLHHDHDPDSEPYFWEI